MADIDTSMNRDPSPTADELLRIRDRMLAHLEDVEDRLADADSVRIIRSANLLTTAWRQHATFLGRKWRARAPGSPEIGRCEQLAETGEHLGLERVGLIVGSEEVVP